MLRSLVLLTLLFITITIKAQTPPMPPMPTAGHVHYVTNVTAVPCTHFHYWGITQYGKVIDFGQVCSTDTNRARFESDTMVSRDLKARLILRTSEDDPMPVVIQQNLDVMGISGAVTNSGGGASNVLPDTNAPVVTLTNLRSSKITDFTNAVPVTYTVNTKGFYWLDAETGQPVTKAFNLRFQALSNQFYTVWICSPISGHETDWREYPSHGQLHPARFDFLAGLAVPLYDSNRFVAVRSFNGTNRITWQ